MKKLMFVVLAVLVLSGCKMFKEEELPEQNVVIEKTAPVEPDRAVIDTAMVIREYPIQDYYTDYLNSGCVNWRTVKSETVNEEPDTDHVFQELFSGLTGCTWPIGSYCKYIRSVGRLCIRNTEENHVLISKGIESIKRDCAMIEIQARFVKVSQETLDAVGAKLIPGKESDHRYDIVDFKSVPAGEFERLLIGRHDLVGNEMSSLLTRPGEEAYFKSVTECIYPTDYEVRMGEMEPQGSNETARVRQSGIATVEPQSFTMREVGTILEVTPGFDGEKVYLKLNACVVDKPEWNEYGMGLPAPNGGSYGLPMKQPFFTVRSIDAMLELRPGETVIADTTVDSKGGMDFSHIVFISASVLEAKGSEKKNK